MRTARVLTARIASDRIGRDTCSGAGSGRAVSDRLDLLRAVPVKQSYRVRLS